MCPFQQQDKKGAVKMGDYTVYDPIRKPPTALERVVAELRRSTNAKKAGFVLASDLDGICVSADKSYYETFAHRRGLQKFLVDHAVVLKDRKKYFVDFDRAELVVQACKTRALPPAAIPTHRRLLELQVAKENSASTRASGQHDAVSLVVPEEMPKVKTNEVQALVVKSQTPAGEQLPALEKSKVPVALKYVLFLTPIQMDVWTTFCVLAREATVDEIRVAIAADADRFFLECASGTLDCTSEEYEETVQSFVNAGLFAKVIGKIVEGKRAFHLLVDQEEFYCVQIQKRDISEAPCSNTYILNGQTLKVWKGFEQFVYTEKSPNSSISLSPELPKPSRPETNARTQMHRVFCDPASANVLLQIARGEYFGGLQRNSKIPYSLVKFLAFTGFLKNDGGGKHPAWHVDTDRAFLTRFQLCTKRDVGYRGKFKYVNEAVPEDCDQWRKDLEEIAAHGSRAPVAETSESNPIADTSVQSESIEGIEPVEPIVAEVTATQAVLVQSEPDTSAPSEMSFDELTALEAHRIQRLEQAQDRFARAQAEMVLAEAHMRLCAEELEHTQARLKAHKRRLREQLEQELEVERARILELEQRLATLCD